MDDSSSEKKITIMPAMPGFQLLSFHLDVGTLSVVVGPGAHLGYR